MKPSFFCFVSTIVSTPEDLELYSYLFKMPISFVILYIIKHIGEVFALQEKTSGDYYFNYQFLVELETENVKAIFIEITKVKSSKKDKLRYLCAPFNNPLLTTKFKKDIKYPERMFGVFCI